MRPYTSSLPVISRNKRRFSSNLVALQFVCAIGLVVSTGIATAQQPSQQQKDQIRAACRSDFMAQCSGVTPGGIEALTCLQQHSGSLSAACRKAVSAISTKSKSSSAAPAQSQPAPATKSATATATAAPTDAQRAAVKSACRSDFMAQCSGVTPGGAAALSCLQQNNAKLSPSCQQAVAAIGGAGAAAGATATAPATTGTMSAAPMPTFTPREELMIVRQSCGPDFRALCSAVPLGGGRGIACLRENAARLSPGCQKVLMSRR